MTLITVMLGCTTLSANLHKGGTLTHLAKSRKPKAKAEQGLEPTSEELLEVLDQEVNDDPE